MDNIVISLIKRHRSVRKYLPIPVENAQLETIIEAAQAASTSSDTQAYTVVAVRDKVKRSQLAQFTRNAYVAECGVFLIWCADFNRVQIAVEEHQMSQLANDATSQLLVSSVDTALAAQNAIIAAESLGLGGVFIGGIRNQPREVAELLKLPRLVYPLFGMCLGVPAAYPPPRPRLPLKAILHYEEYNQDQTRESIHQYDEIMHRYYQARSDKKKTTWTKEMSRYYSQPIQPEVPVFLHDQGFKLIKEKDA
jgi:FMN reductase (NADPH)